MPFAPVGDLSSVHPLARNYYSSHHDHKFIRFFDLANVRSLNNRIVQKVQSSTGILLPMQSEEQLVLLMRSIYNDDYMTDQDTMNQKVVEKANDIISTELILYTRYMKEKDRNPMPLPRGAFYDT